VPGNSVPNTNRDYFLCNAGFSLSDALCEECAADSYKTDFGNLACLSCASVGNFGNFKSTDGATGRTSSLDCWCIRGYGTAEAGGQCQECAVGFWKAAVVDAPCTQCVPGSSTVNPRSYARSLCAADRGFTVVGGLFEQCDTTGFKPDVGNVSCTSCDLHRSTGAPGATDSAACVCTQPAYSEVDGVCHCNPGFYLEASVCELCPSGGSCLGGQAPPTNCPANSNAPAGGSSAASCLCNAGWTGWPVLTNVARTCGSGYTAACASSMTSQLHTYASSYGNDGQRNNLNEFVNTNGGTRPYFYTLDLGTPRRVAYVFVRVYVCGLIRRIAAAQQLQSHGTRVDKSWHTRE